MIDSFLNSVCLFQTQLAALFSFCLLLFVLTVASLIILEKGTASYAISLINLVGVVLFGGISGSLLFLCKRRE
jgi:hypothetical protein